jgi:HSP20 family protein
VEGETLIFKVLLPGFVPQDIELLVIGTQLVIKGKRATPPQDSFRLFSSVSSQHFQRIFPLPDGVNADQLTARVQDGVLEIVMPAPKDAPLRRVPIEVKEERKA